jgi:hypothetical protein
MIHGNVKIFKNKTSTIRKKIKKSDFSRFFRGFSRFFEIFRGFSGPNGQLLDNFGQLLDNFIGINQ